MRRRGSCSFVLFSQADVPEGEPNTDGSEAEFMDTGAMNPGMVSLTLALT